jgi:dTDP-4-amino-4,6-dideoxygalactose transaminase
MTATEKAAARILSLPMFPELSVEDAGAVAREIIGFPPGPRG